MTRNFAEIGHGLIVFVLALLLGTLIWQRYEDVLRSASYWYEQVGPVTFGLAPLTALLLGIGVFQLLYPDWREQHAKTIKVCWEVILYAAPLLGMLGTVTGFSDALSGLKTEGGIEGIINSMEALMGGLSEVLRSTAWGIVLALPAGVALHLQFPEQSQETASNEKDLNLSPNELRLIARYRESSANQKNPDVRKKPDIVNPRFVERKGE